MNINLSPPEEKLLITEDEWSLTWSLEPTNGQLAELDESSPYAMRYFFKIRSITNFFFCIQFFGGLAILIVARDSKIQAILKLTEFSLDPYTNQCKNLKCLY